MTRPDEGYLNLGTAVVAGVHTAFLIAAFASIASIVLATLIRRPASELPGHAPANDIEFPEGMTTAP